MDRENARRARERFERRQELALQKKPFAFGEATSDERRAPTGWAFDLEPDELSPLRNIPSTVSAIAGAYGVQSSGLPTPGRPRHWTVAEYGMPDLSDFS